jgi:hypothetical protein
MGYSSKRGTFAISVIMIDGGFRENAFGAKYFTEQDFPDNQYEVLWVEYYDRPNQDVLSNPRIKAICLNRSGIYHSSYCFNRGIQESEGELIIILDANQIVKPPFLSKVSRIHSPYHKLVVYGHRYNEIAKGALTSFSFEELEKKCIQQQAANYGGCLTVRKKWLVKVNGYEQHPVFQTGYHANGLDLYTRFKNLGLAIQWEPSLKLYHPWHTSTLTQADEYLPQLALIEWRKKNMQWRAFQGIDSSRDFAPPTDILAPTATHLKTSNPGSNGGVIHICRNQITSAKEAFCKFTRAFRRL